MLLVLVFMFLTIKHVLAAHVWDVGYSRSRRRSERWWFIIHFYQVLLEAAISFPLFMYLTPTVWVFATALEICALTLGTVIEREAPYALMLIVHILSEITMLCTYLMIALLIVALHHT